MRVLALTVAVAAVALTLGGCATLSSLVPSAGDGAVPAQVEAAPTPTALLTEIGSVRVGDCFDDLGDDIASARQVSLVPCATDHGYEVYAAFPVQTATYPGKDAVFAAAEDGCGSRFEAFTHLAYDDSRLDYNYFVPVAEAWTTVGASPVVSCVIDDPAGMVAGSLAGASR